MTISPMAVQNKYFHQRQRKREQTDQTNLAGGSSSREGRCLFQNQCGLLILSNTGYKNSIGRHAAQTRPLFSSLVRTLHTLGFISWRCSQTITISTTCVILSLTHSLTQGFTLKLNKLWQRIPFYVARIQHGWFACYFWVPNCRKKQEHSQCLYKIQPQRYN